MNKYCNKTLYVEAVVEVEAEVEVGVVPPKMVEAEAMLFETVEAEAVNLWICQLDAEAVQISTASASLLIRFYDLVLS